MNLFTFEDDAIAPNSELRIVEMVRLGPEPFEIDVSLDPKSVE
jgi:hypothetical protein